MISKCAGKISVNCSGMFVDIISFLRHFLQAYNWMTMSEESSVSSLVVFFL